MIYSSKYGIYLVSSCLLKETLKKYNNFTCSWLIFLKILLYINNWSIRLSILLFYTILLFLSHQYYQILLLRYLCTKMSMLKNLLEKINWKIALRNENVVDYHVYHMSLFFILYCSITNILSNKLRTILRENS